MAKTGKFNSCISDCKFGQIWIKTFFLNLFISKPVVQRNMKERITYIAKVSTNDYLRKDECVVTKLMFLNKALIRLYLHVCCSVVTFDLKTYILRQSIPGQLLFF